MSNKLFILVLFIFFISCDGDTSIIDKTCTDDICKGDQRLIDCPNQKPENSSWENINKDGKIEQIYNGEVFIPEEYDCLWSCNYNYERINEECRIKTTNNDSDNDGVNDDVDNCPNTPNTDQLDTNNDGIGDLCEEIIIADNDNDGINNDTDNCPNTPNTDQLDTDNDGIGDVCEEIIITDNDNDGIDNNLDNCPNTPNPEQSDINSNGIGDACEIQDGSSIHPFIIDTKHPYNNAQNTQNSTNSEINSYPPNELDESGPEYYYIFKLDQKSKIKAYIPFPEPDNTDIDIHVLSSLSPLTLIDRGHYEVNLRLDEGVYYLVMDTYVEDDEILSGEYNLNFLTTPIINNDEDFFNYYILEAIEYINLNYRLLGYASANLTHNIEYGDEDISSELHYGTIYRTEGAEGRTMCVSAQMEIILTALRIYADDTGDYSVYEYLPMKSWTTQSQANIKGHIWVDHDYSSGTGQALANFGMGIDNNTIEFENLKPGGFINLNRTTQTGHATTFLAFLDASGNEYEVYPTDTSIEIIGFKYYSSQGGYDVGNGGMDYRWAIFSDYDTPAFCSTKKCDKNIIFSRNDSYLNVGMMWHPSKWTTPYTINKNSSSQPKAKQEGDFLPADPKNWDGMTSYDLGE